MPRATGPPRASQTCTGEAMALFWRIWAVVTGVACTVLAIFVWLAVLQFDRIHADLVGERLVVLADRTAAPFGAAARLGLPLSSVRNAQALLERARQTDEAIGDIYVFEADGRRVHATGGAGEATLAREIETARRAAEGGRWHRKTPSAFLAGVEIAGRDGRSAGGVVVTYPLGENETRVRAIAAELGLSAILVLLGAASAGGVLMRLGLAREVRAFAALEEAVARFERGAWRRSAGAPQPPASSHELETRLAEAAASYRAAGRAIAAAHEQDAP